MIETTGEKRPVLSVVVPCYNEDEVVSTLVERLSPLCRTVAGDSYEVLLVNDGSRDRTWSLIEHMASCDPHIVGVNLSRNFGHQKALSAGLSVCRGDRVLVIDADLQDPPEVLPEMMRLVDEGADVVYGKRIARKGETVGKRLTAALFYRILSSLTNVDIPVDTGDFRIMRRRVVDALNALPEEHRFIRGLVAWVGFNQVALPYVREQRFAGVTKYPFRKMLAFAVDALTSFSIVPLRLAVYLSFLAFVLTLPLGAYVLYSWFNLGVVQGWASVMVVLLFFGAIQLLSLGILGEYVGRTYMQGKGRPVFLIKEIVTRESVAEATTQTQYMMNAKT